MAALKDQLQADLTQAIRDSDKVTSATIRMALTAVTNEEVSGKQAKELTDEEVVNVLSREAKKRRESAQAYEEAQRPELAQKENEELAVLERYLPKQLSEQDVDAIVAAAVAQAQADGAEGGRAMGAVMKLVTPQVTGRFDGSAVAGKVRAALGMS
ncbi:unannotated protein [freshwater metagenome]|jgi:hypothetical protein|uniref:Unannotated protein n=1 Tax=freshwater metagenome TaxID=449393 RepID=A0A6J7DID9_9ZZZZ|nr:GatB/YqeY domain-containing protein [Actinomycetota bacterium]